MINQSLNALNKAICLLLGKFFHINISVKIVNFDYFSKATKKLVSLSWLIKKALTKVILRQTKTKGKISLIFKTLALSLPLGLYLFLTPHTIVQATWVEKVIPAPIAIQESITSEVVAEKIPTFIAPIHGYLSTYFSRFHPGIDIPNPVGNPVIAAEKGTVIFAGWTNSGHGNLVVIQHNSGFETYYAHLSVILVKEGQSVSQGETIGLVGSTGNSTGSHLHFEIHQNSSPQNPLRFFTP